jgi:hypothetical protein
MQQTMIFLSDPLWHTDNVSHVLFLNFGDCVRIHGLMGSEDKAVTLAQFSSSIINQKLNKKLELKIIWVSISCLKCKVTKLLPVQVCVLSSSYAEETCLKNDHTNQHFLYTVISATSFSHISALVFTFYLNLYISDRWVVSLCNLLTVQSISPHLILFLTLHKPTTTNPPH